MSVREAAVDLLGRHIGDSAELAAAYLDMLIGASRDAGTSVRKRALTILWESCIRCCSAVQARSVACCSRDSSSTAAPSCTHPLCSQSSTPFVVLALANCLSDDRGALARARG